MLAEAHFSLGAAKFQYDYDWPGGEIEFRRALALDPSYAYAHDQYGFYLALRGQLDDAVAEFRIATELDPLSALTSTDMTFQLTWQTKYAAAKEQCRNALALDPNNWFAQWALGWTDIEARKFSEAITEMQKARDMGSPTRGLAGVCLSEGRRTCQGRGNNHGGESDVFTTIRLGARDRDNLPRTRRQTAALDKLEKAYEERDWFLLWLKMDEIFIHCVPSRASSR